jgi:hypothetical protein
MAPKPCTPAYFGAFLARSWAKGTTKVRHLFSDIRHRGYTGSYSHLARFLAPWRNSSPSGNASEPSALDQEAHTPPQVRTLDPMTGRQISSLTAAALCVKPRGGMTARQIINVDALNAASADFTTMCALAMHFRGLLLGGTVDRLDIWLNDARASGIYGMRHFVRALRRFAMPFLNPGAMGRRRVRSTNWRRSSAPCTAALALTCFALGCFHCRDKVCTEIEAEPH